MTKNPFVNALAASLYITAVSSLMFYGPKIVDPEDTVIAPIALLSLFVLSAAIMGYLFLYRPLLLYFDGEKKQAVRLFLGTVAIFALITAFIFSALFLGTIF